MNINDFVDRIKDECPILKRNVFAIYDFDVDTPTSIQPPYAFVIQTDEQGGDVKNGGVYQDGYSQEMTAQIGVVIAVKSFKDLRGAEGNQELQQIRAEIHQALRGWLAPETKTKVKFLAGKATYYKNLTTYWSDVFSTTFIFQSNNF